jgi:hypothetical protein
MDRFQEFAAANPQSLADAKALMQDIEGIKAELNPEVRVRFAGTGSETHPPVQAATDEPASSPVSSPPLTIPAPAKKRTPYEWREIPATEIQHHLLKLVEVKDQGGTAHKGMLRQVSNGELSLRQAKRDGAGTVEVRLTDVEEVRVFDQGP